MIDGREEPAPALRLRPEPRRIRAPKFVRPLGPDPAAVAPVPAGPPPPHRRQQPVLPHQAEHPVLARPDPLGRKPRLHLAVALAEERTRLQHRPDLPQQLLVAQCRLRAPLPQLPAIGRRWPALLRPQRIHARTRDPPSLAHHRQRVRPLRRRTHPSKRLKASAARPRTPFFREAACNSTRIVISPSFARVRISSPPGRFFFKALLAALEELPPPPLQLRRRNPNLPAHLAMSSPRSSRKSCRRRALHRGEAGRPPQSARTVLLVRTP